MVTVTDIKRIVMHYEPDYTKWADENDANTFDELLAEACKSVNKNGGTQEDAVASIEEVMRQIKLENNTA